MTRIVAGSAGGRRLEVPKAGTRPTSERVREALFSRLEHWGVLDDALVLDLYAGSGALAIEAVSRGATRAVCIEASSPAAKVIAQNARATGLACAVVNQKALAYLRQPHGEQFDLVFLDPPYDLPEAELTAVLAALAGADGAQSWLAADSLVLVERRARDPEPAWPSALYLLDERKWGDTRVWTATNRAPDNRIEV